MKLFIPIKKESQRVPNKNFRKLPNGLSLWEHTITKFKNFNIFVDTDCDDLMLDINRFSHVTAYKRHNSLIGHDVSVCDLIVNCIELNNLTGSLGQIHITSPVLKASTLTNAFSYTSRHDSIVACNELHTRLWRKEHYGYCPVNHNPLKLEQTQDLPTLFEENSAFYIFNCDQFMSSKSRIGSNPYFYPISYPENVDIDTEADWQCVSSLLNNQ